MKTNQINLALLALSLGACSSTLSTKAFAQGRIIEFKSGHEAFDTKTYFYEGQNEVIAFDAQFNPELAKKSIAYLRTYTSKPISWLVLTHPSPDKFNGASVFKAEGAKIISSSKTAAAIPTVHAYKEYFFVEIAKMFKKGTYPQPVAVDQTFDNKADLVLKGGEKIELRELSNPGIASNQVVAFLKSSNALIVGDLVHHKAHAWLEGGIVEGKAQPTLKGWIADLNEIADVYPAKTIVYGGRGLNTNLALAVKDQINYLEKAQTLVEDFIKDLGDRSEELNGSHAAVLYKDLANRFANEFPDYDLSYMIEYGAYGLVQSELSKR